MLASMSNRYGSDADYVLAGGGNTSYKDDKYLYIKGSGTSLATIKPEEFVKLTRSKLDKMLTKKYPDDEVKREAEVLSDMMDARVKGENRRPSVETLLHNLFPQKYV
ncbi:MAG: class II aldolase/adducin family protein, partial [Clostridia bacterium]|nr:class II aldolase/adducin family protein [Clostridia bacterium]